jgi:ubiquinone/menaquinone biosynthesis C-methylase UbiE
MIDISSEAPFERRLREAYRRRDAKISSGRYSVFNSAALFTVQSRERRLLRMLRRAGITSFAELKILDVGCGAGGMLRTFNQYGAAPRNLFGVDILSDRIAAARRLAPHIDFRCVNAEHLPFEDSSFDLVSCLTLFDTILEPNVRQTVAQEILRVVRYQGVIVWYDFRVNNLRNPDARRVGKREIQTLFAGCEIDLVATTLAPPLARVLANHAWLFAVMLEALPLLCTHYLGLIRPGRRVPKRGELLTGSA